MAAKDLLLTLMIKAKDAASATIRRITSDSTDLASGLDEAGSAADHSGKQLDDVGETAAYSGAQLTDAARAAEHFSDQLSEADQQAGRFYDGMDQLKEANGEFVQGAAAAVGSAATLGKTLQGTSGQASTRVPAGGPLPSAAARSTTPAMSPPQIWGMGMAMPG